MAQIYVTLMNEKIGHIDLALPEDVPCQLLAEALIKTLGLPVESQRLYSLAVLGSGESPEQKLSHATTLAGARVRTGAVIHLWYEKAAPLLRVYLTTEGGVKFPLANISVIGRYDKDGKQHVDVDLSPLPGSKIVSHRHALIREYQGVYFISDERSRNGTFVNGKRLEEGQETRLNSDDILDLAPPGKGVRLKFVQNA